MPNAAPKTEHLKPYQWKPGQSGNPGGQPQWRSALERTAKDGSELFGLIYKIATAQAIPLRDTDGKPLMQEVRVRAGKGYRTIKRRAKLVPTLSAVLQAQQTILDRAFGKPSQAVEVNLPGENGAAIVLPELPDDDRAVILAIARRRLLANPGGNGQGSTHSAIPEMIDVTPDPGDPEERSSSTGDPGASEGRDE